ncbi:MAG: protein kinase [Planctomycetes bacterium]|nr:protein kinase [Planctomycetota bacterium]
MDAPDDARLARKAVDLGWVSLLDVERAEETARVLPGTTIIDHLPLNDAQRRELGAPARALPSEVRDALKDPSRRVGRYVLVALIGAGGMGSVFRAWDGDLRRWVAIKFLRQIGDDTARAYFRREALVAASLDHPNIAKMYEVGEREGAPFIAMQLVEGETLADRRGRMGAAEKIAVVKRIAEAIGFAHGKGVIHRDVKPGNVMVDREGHVYVMDFGLAKEVEGPGLTQAPSAVGTPNYMAPEQARGRATAQSDVYAIGAILYELEAGRPPFLGATAAEVLVQVTTSEPPWPRRVVPGLSEDVEAVILKCMEKDLSRRYAGVAELIEDLAALETGEALVHARRRTVTYVLARKVRRNPKAWTIGTALGLLLAAGAAFGTVQLVRARRAERLREEERRLNERREEALRRLAAFSSGVMERKHALRRSGPANSGTAREELRRVDEALGRFLQEWPLPQGYYIRARGRYYLGDLDGAQADLRRALEIEPSFRPAWSLLGMAKMELYQDRLLGTGEMRAERRRRAQPILQEALEALRRGWEPGKEREEAERWGLVWSLDDQVARRLADALRAEYIEGDRATAVRLLREGHAQYRAEEYVSELGFLSSTPGENIALQSQAIDLAPGYAKAWFRRGTARVTSGDPSRAIPDLDRAIELRPGHAAAHNNRANARSLRGDHAGAVADYDRALALDAREPIVACNRGKAKQNLGDSAGAEADFTIAIELKPDYADAFYSRASVRCSLGDFAGSARDYERVLALKGPYARALSGRGLARYCRREFPAALADLAAARLVEPKGDAYVELLLRVCRARLRQRPDAAIRGPYRDEWVPIVASFLAGEIEEPAFLLAATASRERFCEAHFYAGSRRLADGNSAAARTHFKLCVATGLVSFSEHAAATAELAALR